MSSGSADSLNPSVRCGWSPKSRQIRPTVDLESPDRRAIDARDQCVALVGVCSSVATITSSTWSRVTDGGRPGRSSSASPSSRLAKNRRRHLPTVSSWVPSLAATSRLASPSAHASTIFDRNARACDDFARRAQRVS